MPRGKVIAPAAAAAGVLLLIATACSAPPEDPRPSSDASAFAAAGAWAPEFAEADVGASDYERRVLQDGIITAVERADAQNRMRSCMRGSGYDYDEAEDGTASAERADGTPIKEADSVNTALQACSRRYDRYITVLYNDVRRNPEKQDEAEITVACLQEAGLVNKSYSERTWRAENDSGRFSFNEYDPAAVQCRLDPLGLWRKQ